MGFSSRFASPRTMMPTSHGSTNAKRCIA